MENNNFRIALFIASANFLDTFFFKDNKETFSVNENVLKDHYSRVSVSNIIEFLKEINVITQSDNKLFLNNKKILDKYQKNSIKILLSFFYMYEIQARWVKSAYQGSQYVIEQLAGESSSVNSSIYHIFKEAELLDEQNDIEWWKDFQIFSQSLKDETSDVDKNKIGSDGEMLSYNYEKKIKRIDSPILASIKDSNLGYDIESKVNNNVDDKLFIEVKTSTEKISEARAFISRNELEVAKSKENYIFHFWSIYDRKKPKLAIIKKDKIKIIDEYIDLGSSNIETLSENFITFESDFHVVDGLE